MVWKPLGTPLQSGHSVYHQVSVASAADLVVPVPLVLPHLVVCRQFSQQVFPG